MARVLILGGGFGGVIVAEKLAAALLPSEHQITLVSRNPKFIFYPGLVQAALGRLEPKDIAFDLQAKLSSWGVRFVHGEVIEIEPEIRRVKITGEDVRGELIYDYLIIALGRRLATEKIPGFFEHAHHLLDVDAALKFHQAIKEFQEGNVVVGMCPGARLPVPVCETAFALARKFGSAIAEKRVSISVVFPETIDKAFGGANLRHDLESAFEKYGINLVTHFPVSEISEKEILSGAQVLNHDLLMLVPPFQGQAIIKRLGEASDDSGYARVNSLMHVYDWENTYAAGDIAAFSGPKLAHMAVQQAKVVSANIISEISGEIPDAEYYHEIATIIDQGGADSIYLHYGIWDETLYKLQQGTLWSWIKNLHDKFWQTVHF
jgi:sulfide:quinone oxidoreductase